MSPPGTAAVTDHRPPCRGVATNAKPRSLLLRRRSRSVACGLTACVVAAIGAAGASVAAAESGEATHAQARLIKVIEHAGEKLTTFAVDQGGQVLAGVVGDAPSIRVYDPRGDRVADWILPIPPEAVNVGPKGDVFVAGQGKLLKLDGGGAVKLDKQAPNMPQAAAAAADMQQRVLNRREAMLAKRIEGEIKIYKKRLADMERKIADIDQELFKLDQRELEEHSAADTEAIDTSRTALQKRRAACEKLREKIDFNLVNPPTLRRVAAGQPAQKAPPQVPVVDTEQLIAAQMRIASISASKDEVFFACSSSNGTGFDVWRTDYQFAGGRKIGESLRGCCGQLDVQANDNGIYVAENTRHRVRGFNRDGRELLEFGSRERGREDGFDGCCNPMNVAFGDDGSVYTAESGSGRIKRFTAAGVFLELVGQVELVPGCKKVSIAVSPRGDQVYMLDITRGHIVVMTRDASATSAAATARGATTLVRAE